MADAAALLAVADDIPGDKSLTAQQADQFWPGIAARIKDDRHHKRPTPPRDDRKRYVVDDLREYWGVSHLRTSA